MDIDNLFQGAAEGEIRESNFLNIHYASAAASCFGAEARMGAEYPGKTYVSYKKHAGSMQACVDCHDPHTLQVDLNTCSTCHIGLNQKGDLHNIRMSTMDFDNDGNTTEGVYYEIEGIKIWLYAAIQSYAIQVIDQPIVYNVSAFPYFFNDSNSDGQAGDDESGSDNAYHRWNLHLEKAAFNYNFSQKESGAYVHNDIYMIQLLCDSLEDLGKYVQVNGVCNRP